MTCGPGSISIRFNASDALIWSIPLKIVMSKIGSLVVRKSQLEIEQEKFVVPMNTMFGCTEIQNPRKRKKNPLRTKQGPKRRKEPTLLHKIMNND